MRLYTQDIAGDLYDVHSLYVTKSFHKKVKDIRLYFTNLDNQYKHLSDGKGYKIRNTPEEVVDSATYLLDIIEKHLDRCDNQPLSVGCHLFTQIPWAIFGQVYNKKAEHHFHDFTDLILHYPQEVVYNGGCKGYRYIEKFIIRKNNYELDRIAAKYNVTFVSILSVALSLLYDVIMNCHPTTKFIKLYTNDNRDKEVSVTDWIVGRYALEEQSATSTASFLDMPLCPQSKSYSVCYKVELQEIEFGDDISEGEKIADVSKKSPVVYPYERSISPFHRAMMMREHDYL